MKTGLQRTRQKSKVYLVSLSNFRYPSHSLHTGFPMYFGFPSLIFKMPGTNLQIQQSAIIDDKIGN